MFKGFREFVFRGNVVDLAVAVVLAGAFGAVITSFVADILTPLLGLLGVPDFTTATVTVGSAEVRYGLFLNALIAAVNRQAARKSGQSAPLGPARWLARKSGRLLGRAVRNLEQQSIRMDEEEAKKRGG